MYIILIVVKLSHFLLATSIVFYIGYDILSTLAAYNYLGTFDYEKSVLIKAAFDVAGVPGFIGVKTLFSTLAIFTSFLLMERYHMFKKFGAGILAGATLAGLFVGTSNFNIILNGSSFWIFGIDSGTIATIIIIACALGGYVFSQFPGAPIAGTDR